MTARLRAALCVSALLLGGCRGRAPDAEAPAIRTAVPAPPGRTIVLVVFDTTRLDEFGAYGSRNGVTPSVDELAGSGLVYEAAFATDSFTMPSHAAMFSGRLTGTESRLPSDGSLVPSLRSAGFRTIGVSANWILDPATGFDQGFDVFTNVVDPETRKALARGTPDAERRRESATGRAVVSTLAGLLAPVRREESLFLFVNFFDPHDPYTPQAVSRSRFAPRVALSGHLRAPDGSLTGFLKSVPGLSRSRRRDLALLYRAEVFDADAAFGELRAVLRRLGRDADALYVVTADHGELLGERNQWTHNIGLSEPEVHVPLVVAGPGVSRESRAAAVSLTGVREAIETWSRTGAWAIRAQASLLFHHTFPGNEAGQDPLVATDEVGLVDGDRRITRSAAGCRLFERAKPYWREAPCQVASGPGAQMTARLNDEFRSRVGPRLKGWTQNAPSAEWLRQLKSLGYLAP